jgi:hypothetical protein
MAIIIDERRNLPLGTEETGGTIRRITFCRYALIPVMKRGCTPLDFDRFQPGIFAGWLIKMSMDTTKIFHVKFSFQGVGMSLNSSFRFEQRRNNTRSCREKRLTGIEIAY